LPRVERGYHFDSGSKELIGGKVTPDDGEDGAMIALKSRKRRKGITSKYRKKKNRNNNLKMEC
jgi:hypothetical protein